MYVNVTMVIKDHYVTNVKKDIIMKKTTVNVSTLHRGVVSLYSVTCDHLCATQLWSL